MLNSRLVCNIRWICGKLAMGRGMAQHVIYIISGYGNINFMPGYHWWAAPLSYYGLKLIVSK